MKIKKIIVRSLLILLIAAIGVLIYFGWVSFPIMAAYGAKIMCSAVFDAGRNEKQVRDQDLSAYMMKLGDFKVDYADSSVTGSIFGMAKRKAIYRHGLGTTVVSELSEQQIRSQQIRLPLNPQIKTDTIPWPMGDQIGPELSLLMWTMPNCNQPSKIFLWRRIRFCRSVQGQLL